MNEKYRSVFVFTGHITLLKRWFLLFLLSLCATETSLKSLPIFMRVQLLSICWLAWRKYLPSVHMAACCSVTMAVPKRHSKQTFICKKTVCVFILSWVSWVCRLKGCLVTLRSLQFMSLKSEAAKVLMSEETARWVTTEVNNLSWKVPLFSQIKQEDMTRDITGSGWFTVKGFIYHIVPDVCRVKIRSKLVVCLTKMTFLLKNTLKCTFPLPQRQNKPAEPLNPQMYSRLQSHGAMYSLWKTQTERGGRREISFINNQCEVAFNQSDILKGTSAASLTSCLVHRERKRGEQRAEGYG